MFLDIVVITTYIDRLDKAGYLHTSPKYIKLVTRLARVDG